MRAWRNSAAVGVAEKAGTEDGGVTEGTVRFTLTFGGGGGAAALGGAVGAAGVPPGATCVSTGPGTTAGSTDASATDFAATATGRGAAYTGIDVNTMPCARNRATAC